ncbi:MFS transporter [Kribbella solani]|uniref:DHA2 family multidrug resistance protein-like MFS transporter n=1 Tax=Kribbella solani TaxID=236067 RepID=A0A841DNU4_9ACTN|nr:MFS transporter [Kribbella solani]MBB5980333.1 DHA2 family multidrug resistance protein-like MFS transporter [Kribbella solani]
MRPDRNHVRTWCGLLVLLCPALLTSMDASLLFVAGPAISAALHPTSEQWLWAMDIYHFVMAGLLMTVGSLGDRIGRKRLLLIGAAVFGGVSVLVAYAPNPELLILARALMAIGGATLAPSTLSLIRGMFDVERQRRMAVGAWTAAFTGGAVAGPIVGGVLLNHFWWGAVFLINVPVMLVLLIVAPFLIDERKSAEPVRFDLVGAGTSLVAILGLVFAATQIPRDGLTPAAIAGAGAGIAAGTVFGIRQVRASHPLIDLSLFRSPGFSTAVATNTVVALVTAGLGVLAFPFMQNVHGLTPLDSALWALPTLVGSFVGTASAAALAERFTSAALLITGMLAATAGFVVIVTLDSRTGLWVFLAGYVVLTYGVGLTATIANSLVLTSAPPDRAGAASGISETATMLGAAVGIATLGTIASTVYRNTMGDGVPPAALESVTGAVAAGGNAIGLLDAAFAAYTRGLVVAALLAATVTAVLAIVLIAIHVSGKAAACQRRWGE